MPAKEECYDHEGRKFNSKLERRKYWGMTACFEYRYSRMGLSFGEIVDKMQKHVFIDHEGNEFPSKKARWEFWGIPQYTGIRLEREFQSFEDQFNKFNSIKKKTVFDHEGNEFPSKKARAIYWGLPIDYELDQEKLGLNFEQIVKKNQNRRKYTSGNKISCVDHEGNEFPSKAARREFWGIPNGFERICENKGLSFEKTVELYKLEGYTPKTIEVRYFNDPISNKKLTIRELSKKYGIPISTIDGRCRRGLSTACIIGISPAIVNNLQYLYINKKIYGLFIEKRIKKGINVFECYLDGDDGEKHFKIMSQEMIDNYCVEQYKLEHGIM